MGRGVRAPHSARPRRLVRRLRGGEGAPHRARGLDRRPHPARRKEAPRLLPPPLRPEGRRARRAPHVHLHADAGRGGAEQQLDGARRGLPQARRPARRLHERPHDVRRAVRHGPARLAAREGRRRDHGQRLRRPEHADHDAHGESRARGARRLGRLQPRPARHARPRPGAPVHLPLSAGRHDLVRRKRLRRQRASRQEVPRPAHRLVAREAGRLDGRAHAHHGRRGPARRDDVRRGRVSERVREDELRDAHPAEALRRLARVDRGRRHLLDAARARRAPLGDQSRERLLRRRARDELGDEPEPRCGRSRRTRSTRTSPSRRTETSGGRARTVPRPTP